MNYIANFSIFKPHLHGQEINTPTKVVIPSSPELILKALQLVIEQDDSQMLETLQTDLTTTCLAQALPNGELPLNYAIKHRQLNTVKCLIARGANPTQKDEQQLNAFDHAFILNTPEVLTELLAPYITIDAETASLFMRNKTQHQLNAAQTVSTIHKTREQVLSKKLKERLKPKLDIWNKTQANENLKSQICFVEELRNDSAIKNELERANSSILHLIIFLKNSSLLKAALEIPEIKAQINQADSRGLFPAHYAVGMGQLDLVNELIKNNVPHNLPNSGGVTPLSLALFMYACAAQKKNPLNISRGEILSFIAVPAFWALMSYGQRYLNPTQYESTFTAINSYYSLTALYNIVQAVKNKKLGAVFTATSLLANSYMPAGIAAVINVAEISLLAKKMFNDVKLSWQNRHFGRGKALLKAIISIVPSANQAYSRISTLGRNTLPWREYLHAEKFKKLNEDIEKCQTSNDVSACTSAAWEVNLECNWHDQSSTCRHSRDSYKFWVNNRPASAKEMQQFQDNIDACWDHNFSKICQSRAGAVIEACKKNIDSSPCKDQQHQWKRFETLSDKYRAEVDWCEVSQKPSACFSMLEDTIENCSLNGYNDCHNSNNKFTHFKTTLLKYVENRKVCEQKDESDTCNSIAQNVFDTCSDKDLAYACARAQQQWNQFLAMQNQHKENLKDCDNSDKISDCRGAAEKVKSACNTLNWSYSSYSCMKAKEQLNYWKNYKASNNQQHQSQSPRNDTFFIALCKRAAETLGIKLGEPAKIAEKAFRKRAVKVHPDKNPDPDAAKQFIALNNAKEAYVNEKNHCFKES